MLSFNQKKTMKNLIIKSKNNHIKMINNGKFMILKYSNLLINFNKLIVKIKKNPSNINKHIKKNQKLRIITYQVIFSCSKINKIN